MIEATLTGTSIYCPKCNHRHIDVGHWATAAGVHQTHLCTPETGGCGELFKVPEHNTQGEFFYGERMYPDAWLQMNSGRKFYPIEPHPNDVCIEDIAWGLSQQCRYVGQTKRFYSVAEHCLYVSYACTQENKLWGLLHDASETYLCDIPKPIKWVLRDYHRLEIKVEQAIARAFNLPLEIPAEVKTWDWKILGNEKESLMAVDLEWGGLDGKIEGLKIPEKGIPIEEVHAQFLEEFYKLTKL